MTRKCNLRCPHCYVNFENDEFDEEKFLKQLNSFDGYLILFGGEFTADMDRFRKVVKSNKEHGISKFATASTNLIILNDELLEFYKTLSGVGTSWNLDRFGTHKNYKKWLKNLYILVNNKIPVTVLITMTQDLIKYPIKDFLKILKEFDNKDINIKFEHYIGQVDPKFYSQVDDWLCELYRNWDMINPLNITKQLERWYKDCDETYSLLPNGMIINKCAHESPTVINKECLTCPDAINCRPCRLIPYCSYPRKLAKLIKEEEGR